MYQAKEAAPPYVCNFHECLLRGGLSQTALMKRLSIAQRLIREDIIDKVLKRDMTANFDARQVLDLEHTFLYLCMRSDHDSCKNAHDI